MDFRDHIPLDREKEDELALINTIEDEICKKFQIERLKLAAERAGGKWENMVSKESSFDNAVHQVVECFIRLEKLGKLLRELRRQNETFPSYELSFKLRHESKTVENRNLLSGYDLTNLHPDTFEEICQKLADIEFGKEAIKYVLFYEKNTNKDPEEWFLETIQQELKEILRSSPPSAITELFVLVTNIVLRPDGSYLQVENILREYSSKLNINNYYIWDKHKISQLLDQNPSIIKSYAGFIIVGDVLKEIKNIADWSDSFEPLMTNFLQNEFTGSDQYARLCEGGDLTDRKSYLADVFVDLPVMDKPIDSASSEAKYFAKEMIQRGGLNFRRSNVIERSEQNNRNAQETTQEKGRFVLIGGPGEGKSTLVQFLCQLYRASILKDRPPIMVSENTATALRLLHARCECHQMKLPKTRRFPMRIEIKSFADDLASEKCSSLLDYIARYIAKRAARSIDENDLDQWLKVYPWLLILDGLDEVPASSNRADVIDRIQQFSNQCATMGADVLIIATSRQQGYGEAFDSHQYCHLYLSPLLVSQALEYAKLLVQSRYHNDSDLQNTIMERLNRAAKLPTCKQLMRTPLQVTILAVLARSGGQLPDDRWQLFEEYYQTIYKRETQRGLSLSPILDDYRDQITRLHGQVGLYLQTANELAGQNNKLLSKEMFGKMVEETLSECFGDRQAEMMKVARKIIEAALERLVFLVSPTEQNIGFEIRSLQEFMAARELILDTKDEYRCQRLNAIAPFQFWRNVFLFAAAACAHTCRHLMENIIGICHTLNSEDQSASLTLAGSRLALSLLEDASFRQFDKHQRSLVDISLQLLELPPEQSHHRLVNAFRLHCGFESLYENAIRKRLSLVSLDQRLSAWIVLLEPVILRQEWAKQLASEFWPTSTEDQITVLKAVPNRWAQDWLFEKLLAVIPAASPQFCENMMVVRKDMPSWLEAITEINRDRTSGRIRIYLDNDETKEKIYLYFSRISNDASHFLASFADMPNPSKEWAPFRSGACFQANPTHETLAQELLWLGEKIGYNPCLLRRLPYVVLPWPLLTCLRACHSASELTSLAKRVQNQEMGDADSWRKLEEKWICDGLNKNDILALDSGSNFIMDFAWQYFGCIFQHSFFKSQEIFWSLLRLYQDLKTDPARGFLSFICIMALNGLVSIPQQFIPDFKQWLLESKVHYLSIDKFNFLAKVQPLPEEWIEFFDWVGYQQIQLINEFDKPELVQKIMDAYCCNPHSEGLLVWVESAAISGYRIKIGPHLVSPSDPLIEPMLTRRLNIRLAIGNLGVEEAKTLASKAAERVIANMREIKKLASDIAGIIKVMPNPRVLAAHTDKDWAEVFATTFVQKICQHCPGEILSPWIKYLNDCLAKRTSPLQNKEVPRKLGLESLIM